MTALLHNTKAQLLRRWRQKYRNANRTETWRLAAILNGWIAEGFVTDNQMMNAFNQTAAELSAFKTRIANASSKWTDLLNSLGE